MIKIKNYVKNESPIALLEEKLLNTAESIFNTQIYLTRPTWTLGCLGNGYLSAKFFKE